MTVKEAASVLKFAKEIKLGWGGSSIKFQKNNDLMMEAYGNFVVDSIQSISNDDDEAYEINIAMQPVKVG